MNPFYYLNIGIKPNLNYSLKSSKIPFFKNIFPLKTITILAESHFSVALGILRTYEEKCTELTKNNHNLRCHIPPLTPSSQIHPSSKSP